MEDEEEMLKSNTDCVYFLASPFTCKKGLECEYRHNEMARLNPRDCWYWKNGNCLNPTCGFRHPPLDVNSEALVGVASISHFSSVPPSKHNVPCYFYFGGFCNKGDRCTFLHDPDDSMSVKPKFGQETTDAPASDAKTTVKTEPSLLPKENSLKISNEIMAEPKDCAGPVGDAPQSDTTDTVKTNALTQTAVDEYDVGVAELDSLSPSENLDETHEYFIGDQVKKEEWLEPSPGLEDLDVDHKELEHQDTEFGYEDQMDAEARNLLDETRLKCQAYSDNEPLLDGAEFSSPYTPHEELFTMELPAAGLSSVDLRHRLRNRRNDNDQLKIRASRSHNLSRLRDRRHERLLGAGPPWQFYRRLLVSELERNGVALPARRNGIRISVSQRRWSNPWLDRYNYRRSFEIASKHSAYNFSRRPLSKQQRHSDYSFFAGPKTPAPIKVESSKGGEDGHSLGNMRRPSKNLGRDFEGPKPLSEILREKNRAVSVGTLDV